MARITQRENGKWQSRIERQGFPPQSKTFQTKSAADAWTRAVEREMDIGAFIKRKDAERKTFKYAADRYLNEVLPSKRGAVQDAMRLKRLVEYFGKYSLASISSDLLSEYRDKRLKAVSAQTVVHELGMITRVFKACSMDWGIALPQGLPTLLVRKPVVANARTRRLEANEETLLFAALRECKSPWPHAAAFLAVETAGRQSELLSLRWKEVDLVRRTARLRGVGGRSTKNGDEYRDVPLSTRAVELLATLPRSVTGRVVPISQNALQLSFERALSRGRQNHIHGLLRDALGSAGLDTDAVAAQIRALIYKKKVPLPITLQLLADLERDDTILLDFHFHDLRHEATSLLASRLEMHELMKVTGHKTSKMLITYYHPRIDELALKLP